MSEQFVIFMLGIVAGYALSIAHMMYLGIKSLKKTESNLKSINERLKRVKEITNQQMDLNAQIDGPQKNAMDGKYKNGMISKLKKLEEEKNDVLRSILVDGHDPELTTVDTSGVVTKMKLSEYMAYMGISVEPVKKETEKKTGLTAERIGRFTVVKGGKNDDSGTTH